MPTPRNPHSIAIFEWAEPPNTCKASVGLTPRDPFFQEALVLRLGVRDSSQRGTEADPDVRPCARLARPWQLRVLQRHERRGHRELRVRSSRFSRFGGNKAAPSQSRISPPQCALNWLVSKPVMREIPLRSARIPRQNFSFPMPMQVIGPIPVMTARRRRVRMIQSFDSFRSSLVPILLECLFMQARVRPAMCSMKNPPMIRSANGARARHAKIEVVQNGHPHAVL